MRFVRTALFGLLTVATITAAFAQGNRPTQTADEFRRMLAMGTKYRTASEFYAALKAASPGGGRQMPAFAQLPDWSGLWMASGGGNFFSPGPGGTAPKLTPAAQAALKQGADNQTKGIEYDENLSQCGPPGYPRWLVIPFLREFIVRPEETWLTSETVNNVRRIYTDGRDHPPVDERYPLYYGDSIGFWDGPKLVIHTNQLMERSMGRNQPTQSEKMETVEIWQTVNPTTVKADVWIFDPAHLHRAVVRPAAVCEAAERGQEPSHPLLELQREPEQRCDQDAGRKHELQGLHVRRQAEGACEMIGRIAACVALTLVVVAPLRVEAHHSAVMFDDQKEVTLDGTVKEFPVHQPALVAAGGRHQQGWFGDDRGDSRRRARRRCCATAFVPAI
jgi:hypothetical protein